LATRLSLGEVYGSEGTEEREEYNEDQHPPDFLAAGRAPGRGAVLQPQQQQKLWEWIIVHGTMVQVRYQQSLKENDVKGTATMRGVAEQRLKSLFKTEAALVRIDVQARNPLTIGK